jgi:peptidoglycan hydrolase CwlO-like protein
MSCKQKISKTIAIGVCAVLVVLASPVQLTKTAHANSYDDQIRALQAQMAPLQQKANELNQKANSLQSAVDALIAEKNALQAQIDLSQAKFDKLTRDIEENKKKLAVNQEVLGSTIADLYVDDGISPLEMLASSKNVSDYMDKQEYRTAVSEKLNTTIANIKALKIQLETDQKAVEQVIAEQRMQREMKAAKEAEQQQLLDQTRGEEAVYQQLTAEKRSQIDSIRAQQAAMEAAIRRAGGGRGPVILPGTSGGYPWNDSNCFVDAGAMSHGGVDGRGGDGLGYGCRQCTSYVAWRAYKESGHAPANWGDAIDFPGAGAGAGFTVSSQAREKSIAVMTSTGRPGHVAWVESVNLGAGTMIISQYNYYNAGGSGWGHYSKMEVSVGAYQKFVYF